MNVFEVGAIFHSYEDVKQAMKIYQKQQLCKFRKRDSHLLTSTKSHFEIQYDCIYQSAKFRKTKRAKTKQQCPAHVAFKVTKDGSALEVRSISENHNHEILNCVAHQQQFNPENTTEHVIQKGKGSEQISLSDILAIKYKLRDKLGKQTGNLKVCTGVDNAEINIFDDNGKFKGILIQTPNMKKTFIAYPEFLGIYGTYKLVSNEVPVFLITAEDGNYQTNIVCFCLLIKEDKDSFQWFLETFKKNNLKHIETKSIVIDKDLIQRSVINELFPEKNVIIYTLSHPMHIFDREIAGIELGITQSERSTLLQIVQKMIYARTESEFQYLYNVLKDSASKPFLEYFDKNWYSVKEEWTVFKNYILKTCFRNTTNHHMQSINTKLSVSKNNTLQDYIYSFFDILLALEQERHFEVYYQLQKREVTDLYSPDSKHKQFLEYLTYESCKMIIKQIELSETIVNQLNDSIYSSKNLHWKPSDCSCEFRTVLLLPCKHIFALRKHLSLPLFSEDNIHKRWTLNYYKISHQYSAPFENQPSSTLSRNVETMINKNPLPQQQQQTLTIGRREKRKKPQSCGLKMALLITNSLASLVEKSFVDDDSMLNERIENLTTLGLLWTLDQQTDIVIDSDDEILSTSESEELNIVTKDNRNGTEENRLLPEEDDEVMETRFINNNRELGNSIVENKVINEDDLNCFENLENISDSNETSATSEKQYLVTGDSELRKLNDKDYLHGDGSSSTKCVDYTVKQLEIIERRLALKEQKLVLEKQKFALEKEARAKRLQQELKERMAKRKIIEQHQFIYRKYFK